MDMNLKKNKELPKWFDGEIYTKGDTVTNPFTGESYKLTGPELSMYDLIMGCQILLDMRGGPFNPMTARLQKDMARGLGWFRVNNAKAYMVLLD
jgi:hypothetical protein